MVGQISYRCTGLVRGPCGQTHPTVAAALACVAADQAAYAHQGAEPDRVIEVYRGGEHIGYVEHFADGGAEFRTLTGRPLAMVLP